ncbi:MAG TPA: SMC-Scp complex subunit ScpB [Tepiditoga sp.]|nr:SMC-Scp complex subunit ScpB [Tepiditoga sp.]
MNILIPQIEAYIFTKTQGVSENELSKFFGLENEKIKEIIKEISLLYIDENHGVELIKNDEKYYFRIKPEIKDLITPKPKTMDLTESQFEVLTILFLNGPSRLIEIEKTRGKNSYFLIKKLKEYGLITKIKKGDSSNSFLYTLSNKFYEWIPDKSLKRLEELKNAKITENSSDDRNIT